MPLRATVQQRCVDVICLAVTCDQAFFLKGRKKNITPDIFIRPAANHPLIEKYTKVWLNCYLRADQDLPEMKSLNFHETRKLSAEYNLYSCIYTCTKTWPCFEKQMCSEAEWDGAWEK